MNVGLSVLWRLDLHYQVDTGDVKSSGCDICGHQNVELFLLEPLQGHFALVLRNVTMHDLDVLLDFVGEQKLVGLQFGRGEHDGLSDTVADEDVSEG